MSQISKVTFPRREAAKARTRLRIENAARHLFITHGYSDATMAAIADAADVHITTLFTHFASKRDLAEAIAISAGERFAEIATEQRDLGVPVLRFWRHQVLNVAQAYERDGSGQISFGRALAEEPDLLSVWSAQHQLQIDVLTDYIIHEVGDRDSVDADGRAQMVAAMLVAGGRMAFDRWIAEGRGGDLVQENERLLDAAEAILASGFVLKN